MSAFGMESPFEPFLRDLERQLAHFRALTEPPWIRMAAELSQAHLPTFPHLDSIRQLENQFRHLDLLTRSLAPDITSRLLAVDIASLPSVQDSAAVLRDLTAAFVPDLSRLADQILGTPRISADLAFPMLRSVHDTITAILPSPDRFTLEFQNSFADQLLRELRDVEAHADDDELPEHLARLVAIFLQRCKSLLPNSTHAWGMFSTLLTVLVLLHGTASDKEREQRIVSRVEQAEQRSVAAIAQAVRQMVDAVDQLRPREPASIQYVVTREVTLRTRPTGKSQGIRVVYPNELASLLESKGPWIKVTAFDYINGSSTTGWVLKKYLKRLEPRPQHPDVTP